jgi:glyoxylase-like metal-dependent hydrolase (beta-lactamase superfamily II)
VIRSVDLSGHHPSAIGYFIDGLAQRLLAVGDAIFAGSMGGCANANAFANARKTIESAISGADDELNILPGHGPATTLGSERMSNPFLAEWLT